MSTLRNARFDYLYRDASNYKAWGSVVFGGVITEDLRRRLLRALETSEFFIAHQVRVPELFGGMLHWPREQDDHCWHEFSAVELTDEEANDRYHRTLEEFILEVERQSQSGWQVFDPMTYGVSQQLPSLG